jgi:hypothetical protein
MKRATVNYRHAKGGLVSVDVDGTVCRYTALGGWVPDGDLTPRAGHLRWSCST